jgi:pimeloyl-ACP methyl ester carboxylesterase
MKPSAVIYGLLIAVLLAVVPLASCGKRSSKGAGGKDAARTEQGAMSGGPQRVQETVIESGDLEIKAVLTVPERRPGELVPGAVIVPTFEHLDRNGSFVDPTGELTFQPYKDLAEQLAERGVATVRYDTRTLPAYVGKINVPELTLEDFYPDALAALELLRNTPGVDPKRLYFIGHGEGAVIAPVLVESKPDLGVRGLVLVAPPLLPYDQLILEEHDYEIRQISLMLKFHPELEEEQGARLKQLTQYRQIYATAFKMLEEGAWEKERNLNGFFQKYWKHAIQLYAGNRERIARLKLPVLIVQGSLDHFVIPQDLANARAAFEATGHVRVELIDPASHHLISPTTHKVETRASDLIAKWLKDPVIPPPKPGPETGGAEASPPEG